MCALTASLACRYDADKSGTIDGTELHVLFTDLGEKSSDFASFKTAMDKDQDGKISFEEFKEHMIAYIHSKVARYAHQSIGGGSINVYEGDEESTIDDIVHMNVRLFVAFLTVCDVVSQAALG